VSLQVAILKVLASHGSGRATLASLKQDIAILTTSGTDWNARMRRLASRVSAVDIFGGGYVVRDAEGWQITAVGREFLAVLEAVTQDNRAPAASPSPSDVAEAERAPGDLIVVGARFRNRIHRRRGAAVQKAL
jgi:hypothetical protein